MANRDQSGGSLFTAGVRWLFPWTKYDYPGVLKGIAYILPDVPMRNIRAYRQGERYLQPAVAAALAESIEGYCAEGLAVAAALREHASKPRVKKLGGFMVVGPDGLDRRRHRGKRL